MNFFFTNVGPALAKQHTSRWTNYGPPIDASIPEFLAEIDDVIHLCRDIEILKSSGIEDISLRLCKDAFAVLPQQLTHLFNCSLKTGIFPDAWKKATVVPIFKGGDRETVGNYCPISLLPLPGKILEKIVHSRISDFLEANTFLTEHQGGFRKGFSTTSTIADLTDNLFTEINAGRTTFAAFVDLKKAFDTVDTHILLNKLMAAGITGRVIDWCTSYLTGRSQKTFVNGLVSTDRPVSCGVPQGSVLGPLFFLVYVNDLQHALAGFNFKLYADDTVLYQSGVNAEDASLMLQASLDKFWEWSSAN